MISPPLVGFKRFPLKKKKVQSTYEKRAKNQLNNEHHKKNQANEKKIYIYIYIYISTLTHQQDATPDKFLSGV